jgi:hypothetical protein
LRHNRITKKTAVEDGGCREIRNGIPHKGRSVRNDNSKVEKKPTNHYGKKGKWMLWKKITLTIVLGLELVVSGRILFQTVKVRNGDDVNGGK